MRDNYDRKLFEDKNHSVVYRRVGVIIVKNNSGNLEEMNIVLWLGES